MNIQAIEQRFRELAEQSDTAEEFKKKARQYARQLVQSGHVLEPDILKAGEYTAIYTLNVETDPGWHYADGFTLTTACDGSFVVEIDESTGTGFKTRTIRK